MVFYSQVAINNFSEILIGLITWKKHPLSVEHANKYVSDMRNVCDTLDKKAIHFNTRYNIHKRYGEKVHTYKRNKQTVWYIIYNLDQHSNVYIQRILSNHTTIAEPK